MTTSCAHHFPFYSASAYDGSEGTTTGHVVSLRSTMACYDFRCKKMGCATKQNINYANQPHTPHGWLPTKELYPANSTKCFSWFIFSTVIFIVKESSNIYIYSKAILISIILTTTLIQSRHIIIRIALLYNEINSGQSKLFKYTIYIYSLKWKHHIRHSTK